MKSTRKRPEDGWVPELREASLLTRRGDQAAHDARLVEVIGKLRGGHRSWRSVAATLTVRGFHPPRRSRAGKGAPAPTWTHPQVIRIARRNGIE